MTTASRTRPDLRTEKQLMRSGVVRLAAMDEVGRGALAGPVSVGVVVVTTTIGRVPNGLRDSKLLTPALRDALVAPVRRWVREWAVGHASPQEIDAWGIIPALRTAGRRALAALPEPVDAVLLDGNHDYLTMPPDPVPGEEPPAALFDVLGASGELTAELTAELAGELIAEELPEVRRVPPPPTPVPRPLNPDGVEAPLPVHLRIKADLTCAAVAGASVLAKTARDRQLVDLAAQHPEYGFDLNKGYGTPEHVAALRRHGASEQHRRSWRLPLGGLGWGL